jgi:DNA modification methylase
VSDLANNYLEFARHVLKMEGRPVTRSRLEAIGSYDRIVRVPQFSPSERSAAWSAFAAAHPELVAADPVHEAPSGIRCIGAVVNDWFAAYHADAVDVARQLPTASVHFNVHSPPFSSLYTYSDSELDMGNSLDDEQFIEHYRFLVREQFRVMRAGRIVAVHCKNLVDYKGRDGRAGIRDFRGELIRLYEAEGFKLHSECTIWKCPVHEMQKTKAHGLLYKQLRTDSSFSRQGMAEYLLAFRKWAREGEEVEPVAHTERDFTLDEWQEIASPVWMNVDHQDVLNARVKDSDDERHLCPLSLDVIQRAVRLWSNPGDVVWSPFAGIGSEGVGAMTVRDATGTVQPRRFLGTELKKSYFDAQVRFLSESMPGAKGSQVGLFEVAS